MLLSMQAQLSIESVIPDAFNALYTFELIMAQENSATCCSRYTTKGPCLQHCRLELCSRSVLWWYP